MIPKTTLKTTDVVKLPLDGAGAGGKDVVHGVGVVDEGVVLLWQIQVGHKTLSCHSTLQPARKQGGEHAGGDPM